MFDLELTEKAGKIIHDAQAAGRMIATAESCTGGLLAGLLTEIAGSSAVFERGFVTYSNAAKSGLLGVDPGLIEAHGAVSAEVANAMVLGAIQHSRADIAISITGIAGPGGGTAQKPVGLVYLGCAFRNGETLISRQMLGDIGRSAVRHATLVQALNLLTEALAHIARP